MDEGLLCSVSWFVVVAAIVKLTFRHHVLSVGGIKILSWRITWSNDWYLIW